MVGWGPPDSPSPAFCFLLSFSAQGLRLRDSDCHSSSYCWIFKVLFIYYYFLKGNAIYLFIYFIIYGCVGSSFLCEGFL